MVNSTDVSKVQPVTEKDIEMAHMSESKLAATPDKLAGESNAESVFDSVAINHGFLLYFTLILRAEERRVGKEGCWSGIVWVSQVHLI